MFRRVYIVLIALLVFVVSCAGSFSFFAWSHKSDNASGENQSPVEVAPDSPAARLTDKQLLDLLAQAPLSPPDKEFIGGVTTNYSNGIAYGKYCSDSTYCYDMWLSGSGTFSQDKACGGSTNWAFNTEFGKPVIADVNNDGIRDILSLSYGATCTATEWFMYSNVYVLTVYTPNKDGTALDILAYSDTMWRSENNAQFEQLFSPDKRNSKNQWIFQEHYSNQACTEYALSTEPILSFEDGHITAKMTRGHFKERNVMGIDTYCFNDLYTVTFDIQGDRLVPVSAKQR